MNTEALNPPVKEENAKGKLTYDEASKQV